MQQHGFLVLHCMCMHAVLLLHGEVSLVRLRAVWMTNHPPSVIWHCWLAYQTCKMSCYLRQHYRPWTAGFFFEPLC